MDSFITVIIFLLNIVADELHCTVMIVTYRPCDCKIFLTQNVIHINLKRTPDRGNGDDGRIRVFAKHLVREHRHQRTAAVSARRASRL